MNSYKVHIYDLYRLDLALALRMSPWYIDMSVTFCCKTALRFFSVWRRIRPARADSLSTVPVAPPSAAASTASLQSPAAAAGCDNASVDSSVALQSVDRFSFKYHADGMMNPSSFHPVLPDDLPFTDLSVSRPQHREHDVETRWNLIYHRV